MLIRRLLGFIATFLVIVNNADAAPQKQHQWKFAITTVFHNDAEYLKEWIEFHKIVGTEHFYMINNRSTDHYLEILQPYIESGEVDLIEWPETDEQNKLMILVPLYNHCFDLARGKVTWMGIIDTCDFLFCKNGEKIPDALEFVLDNPDLQKKCGGFCLNSLMFGTSGVQKIPKNQTLLETLVMTDGILRKSDKLICRPDCVSWMRKPHLPFYKENSTHYYLLRAIDENIQLNQYWTRDEDHFWDRIIPKTIKRSPRTQDIILKASTMNEVLNKDILQYVPSLRNRLGFIKTE